jgi:hypothetical protein
VQLFSRCQLETRKGRVSEEEEYYLSKVGLVNLIGDREGFFLEESHFFQFRKYIRIAMYLKLTMLFTTCCSTQNYNVSKY